MTRILVLGAGMVGSVMARDLAAEPGFDVTAADVRDDALRVFPAASPVRTLRADLSDANTVRTLAAEHDLVVGALSSALGHRALRAVIEAGRPCVDISFMAEDPLDLHGFAESRGVCAVVDCGVAPGMSHILAGRAAAILSPCESLEIYVGGLPVERRLPYEYKAPFAPSDVLEEYTRPARLVEGGRVVVREALSEPELLDFPGIGTLEAFNTDGLRSLVRTMSVPSMKEKTLRYPGHIALMRVLRETGLLSKEPVRVGGVEVRPLDVTSAVLFPKWTFEEGEEDLTVMRVAAAGRRDGRPARVQWDLFDRFDPATRTRSMSRTTGFPATLVARLVASGRFRRPGVHPPEVLGREPGLLEYVLDGLAARGVRYTYRGDVPADLPA